MISRDVLCSKDVEQLLSQSEGLNLEFKRIYHLDKQTPIYANDPNTQRKFIEGQKHELIRDILSLANTNVGGEGREGYLIIGADDKFNANQSRDLFDTSHLNLISNQILAWVNEFAHPRIPDLDIQQVVLDGKVLTIFIIPPTPHIHQTIRDLTVYTFDEKGSLKPPTHYPTHTVFIRIKESIQHASPEEINAIQRAKERYFALLKNQQIKQPLGDAIDIWIDFELRRVSHWTMPMTRLDTVIVKLHCEIEYHLLSHNQEIFLVDFLISSKERILIVEGAPGSGKTIALRLVAEHLLEQAKQNPQAPLAIYVDLADSRGLDYFPDKVFFGEIVRSIGRDFEKFDELLSSRDWVFLFDRFDEMPPIRNAKESSNIIERYYHALENFAKAHRGRVIIASRPFLSPARYSNWAKVTILPLSDSQQQEFLTKANPNKKYRLNHLLELDAKDVRLKGIREFCRLPLAMGLLLDYVKQNDALPDSIYQLFGNYIQQRLNSDKLSQLVLQKIAFLYVRQNKDWIGLDELVSSFALYALSLPGDIQEHLSILQKLELIQWAETGIKLTLHRKMIEFLAAKTWLDLPRLVSASELLTQPQWRGMTVTLLQISDTMPLDLHNEILSQIGSFATEIYQKTLPFTQSQNSSSISPIYFVWHNDLYYRLRILQDGFYAKFEQIPVDIQKQAEIPLLLLYAYGGDLDRMRVVNVLSILPQETKLSLLLNVLDRKNFQPKIVSDEILLRQINSLTTVSPQIVSWLDDLIFRRTNHYAWLFDKKWRNSILFHLSRNPYLNPQYNLANLYFWLNWLEIGTKTLVMIIILVFTMQKPNWTLDEIFLLLGIVYIGTYFRATGVERDEQSATDLETIILTMAIFHSFVISLWLFLRNYQWLWVLLYLANLPIASILVIRHLQITRQVSGLLMLIFSPIIYPAILLAKGLRAISRTKEQWYSLFHQAKALLQYNQKLSSVLSKLGIISLVCIIGSYILMAIGFKPKFLSDMLFFIGSIAYLCAMGTVIIPIFAKFEIFERYIDQKIWKQIELCPIVTDVELATFLTRFRAFTSQQHLFVLLRTGNKANNLSLSFLEKIHKAIEFTRLTKQLPAFLDETKDADNLIKNWLHKLLRQNKLDWYKTNELLESLAELIESKTIA